MGIWLGLFGAWLVCAFILGVFVGRFIKIGTRS